MTLKEIGEKVEAIEKVLNDNGYTFLRIKGVLRLIEKRRHDCIYYNTAKTKNCMPGVCHPNACEHWNHIAEG